MKRLSSFITAAVAAAILALAPLGNAAQQQMQRPQRPHQPPRVEHHLVNLGAMVAPEHIRYGIKLGPFTTQGALDAANPTASIDIPNILTATVTADFSGPKPVLSYTASGLINDSGSITAELGVYHGTYDRLPPPPDQNTTVPGPRPGSGDPSQEQRPERPLPPMVAADIFARALVAPRGILWEAKLLNARDHGLMTPDSPTSSLDLGLLTADFAASWANRAATVDYAFSGLFSASGSQEVPYGVYTIFFKRFEPRSPQPPDQD